MKTILANQLQPEILKFLDELTKMKEETTFVNSKGQKFVMVREEEYRGWRETAYLLSSKKNAKVLKQAISQPLSECRDLKDVLNTMDN
jgi:PHD/YefM family antitoxin component YafN of YafNO toxin-antitoxin module